MTDSAIAKAVEEKECRTCGSRFRRGNPESPARWASRKYCSHACYHAGRGLDAKERFWAKVDAAGEDACWIWTANRSPNGYGQVRIDGRPRPAHRVAYEFSFGAIPEGLVIDHLCGVPLCVNPAHLEAVTQRENVMRGSSPTAKNALKSHCKRGHQFDEENTYVTAEGRHCRTCRREAVAALRAKRRGSPCP